MKENKDFSEEKNEEETAWYEKRPDGSAWYENTCFSAKKNFSEEGGREEKPERFFKNENEKNPEDTSKINLNEFFDVGRGETNEKRKGKKKVSEAVYLPNPPPPVRAGEIENKKEYIELKFKDNPAVKKYSEKRVCSFSKIQKILFGFLFLSVFGGILELSEEISFSLIVVIGVGFGLGAGVCLFIFAAIVLFRLRKKKMYSKPEKFFIIEPYAVEAEYGEFHFLDGKYLHVRESGRNSHIYIDDKKFGSFSDRPGGEINLADCALRLYYSDGNKRREAYTENFYTEPQIQLFTEAFRAGELVVACRKKMGKKSDSAVVLEPVFPVLPK